ncbi:MAG: hypothetical protein RIB46_15780 [Pseudomonadales bacterium]
MSNRISRTARTRRPSTLLTLLTALIVYAAPAIPAEPNSALLLRQQAATPDQAADLLGRAGIREAPAVARVLIAADFTPQAVERTLTMRYRMTTTSAVDLVRRALSDHAAVAGRATLRRSACYRADGTLTQCPPPPVAVESTDPVVAEMSRQLAMLSAAAEETALRQMITIRALEQQAAGGDRVERIDGEHHVTVMQSAYREVMDDAHHIVGKDSMEEVKTDRHITVGRHVLEKVGVSASLAAGQDIGLKAGGEVVIEAASRITLKAGSHFVTIGPGGIAHSSQPLTGGSAGSHSHPAPRKPTAPQQP